MRLLHLKSQFFRNFTSVDLPLSPHFNIIFGDNGSGKSTLLEMIYCLARARSFRTHLAAPIIQYDQTHCTVFGKISSDSFSTSIGFQKTHLGKTTLKLGYQQATPSASELAKLLPLQIFHPESHDLLKGGPKVRRKFIDWGLFYVEPQFIALWNGFHKILKQRNAALVQNDSIRQVQVWDLEMVNIGEALSQLRLHYINQLIEVAKEFIPHLVGHCPLKLNYHAGWHSKYNLQTALSQSFDKDRRMGYTTVGPHRFDLEITMNQLSVEATLSRGEQKRLICALYLAQAKLFKQLTGKHSIYLLDDILSELDHIHQFKVLSALFQLDSQVFTTTLDIHAFDSLASTYPQYRLELKKGLILFDEQNI